MTRLCTAAIVEAAINADDTMTDEHRGAVLATLSRPGDPKLLTVAETAAAKVREVVSDLIRFHERSAS